MLRLYLSNHDFVKMRESDGLQHAYGTLLVMRSRAQPRYEAWQSLNLKPQEIKRVRSKAIVQDMCSKLSQQWNTDTVENSLLIEIPRC